MKTHSLLLASTAALVMTAASPQAFAAHVADTPILLAQAVAPPPAEEKKPEQGPAIRGPQHAPPPPPKQQPAAPPPPKPPAPPQHQAPQPPAPPPAAAPRPPAPPQQPQHQAPQAPSAPPPARIQAPPPSPPPGAPARQERREERRDERRDQRQEQRQGPPPSPPPAATTPPPATQAPPPAVAPRPQPQAQPQQQPTFRGPPPNGQPPQVQPQAQPQPAPQPTFRGPAPGVQPPQGQPQRGAAPPPPPAAAIVPSTQPRDAREFIRRDNQGPAPTMDQMRRERHETQQNGNTFIREGDRIIVRQGDRTYIRHNEENRFVIGARDVRVDRRGDQTFTVVQRPDNIAIINITDADGRLIRRVRRYPDGRQVVIIDNSFARPGYFVDPPPPVIRIPRDRYIVDAWDAQPDVIFGAFMAPPVERIERRYTLDEVRFSEPLRARMPRVDLDINFDSGSWQLTPDQIDKLGVIADGLNRAISRNPREVFMIEGHTDATGNDEDNLSLSDRRAEAVAVALTEQFQVPAENLVTQGYGEQYLKDPTDGPSRINRRVAIRRITPLIDQQASAPPPPR